MKRFCNFPIALALACLLCIAGISYGQTFTYYIDFGATGDATQIDSVKIHNITQDEVFIMPGTDTLVLSDAYVGLQTIAAQADAVKVYPNPSADRFYVSGTLGGEGPVNLALYDLSGRELDNYRSPGTKFDLLLHGLQEGIYILKASNNYQTASTRLVSMSADRGQIRFEEIANGFHPLVYKKTERGSFFHVRCAHGDLFHFTAYGYPHAVVKPFYAEQSASLTIHFQECMDADLNHYPIVYIGEQVWMAENLRTTKYNDGTEIPNVTNGSTWVSLTTGAYCWYNNNPINRTAYGALYNWYALNPETNGNKNPCPEGWHVPSDAEWVTMTTFVGGFPATGGRLKETGFAHWNSPNTGATNERAFSARPGGSRIWNGNFDFMNTHAYFWTSSEQQGNFAWLRNMFHNSHNLGRGTINKLNGFAVRCVKE